MMYNNKNIFNYFLPVIVAFNEVSIGIDSCSLKCHLLFAAYIDIF